MYYASYLHCEEIAHVWICWMPLRFLSSHEQRESDLCVYVLASSLRVAVCPYTFTSILELPPSGEGPEQLQAAKTQLLSAPIRLHRLPSRRTLRLPPFCYFLLHLWTSTSPAVSKRTNTTKSFLSRRFNYRLAWICPALSSSAISPRPRSAATRRSSSAEAIRNSLSTLSSASSSEPRSRRRPAGLSSQPAAAQSGERSARGAVEP